MKHDHFVVQSPDKPAQQLLLLFHGVGDNPVAMGEIGSWFAPLFPDALVVSVGGAEPSGNPAGRQWFSVQLRIVLLFISIVDNSPLCHFFNRFSSDIG